MNIQGIAAPIYPIRCQEVFCFEKSKSSNLKFSTPKDPEPTILDRSKLEPQIRIFRT